MDMNCLQRRLKNQSNMGKFKLHCIFGSNAADTAEEEGFEKGIKWTQEVEGDYCVYEFDTLEDMNTAMDMLGDYDGWGGYFFKEETPDGNYYQPIMVEDKRISESGLPSELWSWCVFTTIEECINWLKEHQYDPNDFKFQKYAGDDIEYYSIIK